MVANSPVWVRRRSSSPSSVSDRPKRWEGVLENTLDQYESERACDRVRMTGCLRAAAASAVCVELVFSDAELWQCYCPQLPPFRKDLPVFRRACSAVLVTPTRIHERNPSSQQVSKLKRTRQQAATASRQRVQLPKSEQKNRGGSRSNCACALFSEYVTACISLDLSVIHSDCATVQGGFRWGSIPTSTAPFFS